MYSSTKDDDFEMRQFQVKPGIVESDEAALGRLGKKAVLKVSLTILGENYFREWHFVLAEVRVSIYFGIQLHRFDHLGRVLDVGRTIVRTAQQQLTTFSLFLVGLQKYARYSEFWKILTEQLVVGPLA